MKLWCLGCTGEDEEGPKEFIGIPLWPSEEGWFAVEVMPEDIIE